MDTTNTLFDATDSYLGYVHQGLYALVVLLDADDNGVVSVETEDDVFLHGNTPTLFQIKHSRVKQPDISENTDAFWKTMRIWCSKPIDIDHHYILVTCSRVRPESALARLCDNPADKSLVTIRLSEAAMKICQKRKEAEERKANKLPFEKRFKGAEAFLKLELSDRQLLVDHMRIKPGSFDISHIPDEVKSRLKNTLRQDKRDFIVKILIEWWHQRVVYSLLHKDFREIPKTELQDRIAQLIADTADDALPDMFSTKTPDDVMAHIGERMQEQIRLVDGGKERIKRAALARYRAINQRRAWLEYDISLATTLTEYDERLVEAWRDYHGPMRHDHARSPEGTKKEVGRKLLDWSHQNASVEIPPPRKSWNQPFYTSGIYQQLADELRVGWHPDYQARLKQQGDNSDEEIA